ncbi:hypothetical protein [Streptomyces sp. NPDC093109]|uniref:hypothetical protein n=1 Tax=Streptomyces sp. NPDC093109 TaxID=3154977 RepID=UPI003450690B
MTHRSIGGIAPPSLHDAWEALADGLHVQRLMLHLAQWREVADGAPSGVQLFAETSASALAARPEALSDAPARGVAVGAGLTAWLDLPARYGTTSGPNSPLAATGDSVADDLLDGVRDDVCRAAVAAVCGASAWWVGVFATIRHLGVHHLTLEPVTDDVGLDVLRTATRTVALGAATRVLQQRLRTAPSDSSGLSEESVRLAYCRAVTGGVVAEGGMPQLLEALGELRLVDLVATSIPWRGRFTKYAGGTGAGQVE